MASTANGRPSSAPVYIEEPAVSKWLFGSSTAGWIWLVARLWLGWEWLQAGWSKLFGGNITWKLWNWGDPAYSLTGDGNIGWIRSGTVKTPTASGPSRSATPWPGSPRAPWHPAPRATTRHRLLLVRQLAGVAA